MVQTQSLLLKKQPLYHSTMNQRFHLEDLAIAEMHKGTNQNFIKS